MANLKFQDVIRFYPSNNQAVYQDMKAAYCSGRLTPFVGAGLSVFCGYKLWPSVLKELAEFIPDDGAKQEALEMVEKLEYLEAAEHIHKHYKPMLRRLLSLVSYDRIESCPAERLCSSAAWVLPFLFQNRPLMTTNFDEILEYVFRKQGCAFERVVEPHDPSLLTQIRQRDIHGLFKLHGDIGRETTSLDRLVFTKTQYDAVYCDGGELIQELKQWYQNQTLLFLGCSLSMDKTMEVLRDVASHDPGIRHFAIVGCKPAQRGELLERFGELGIDAIFYDDSNHDAVRVILERLLEETDAAGYKRFRRSCRDAVPVQEEKRPLMFDSEYFPFSGRETELGRLAEFCEAEEQFLWWSVTGPGGMGKSRLVFEFCKTMRETGWNISRFEASPSRNSEARRLEELPGWTPEAGKALVVLDDVQAYMESVCAWMKQMDRTPRSEDLRILLLEREGTCLSDSNWLGSDFKNARLDEWCYQENFLRLDPMTDPQLMEVMVNYAKAAGKTLNAELLLKTLERVDPEFKRPLYAVAIADARCQGKDPTNWDRDKILDTLLERELKFHLDRLQGISDRKIKISKTLQTQLELLLTDACVRGILPLEEVNWDQYDILKKRMIDAEMEPEEFCQRLGILRTAELRGQLTDQDGTPVEDSVVERTMKVIALNCPDLLKEHLVLKLAFEKKKFDLLPDGWHLDLARLIFLRRLWVNYPNRLKDEAAFWDRFFSAPANSGLPAWLYADLLWGCTDVFQPLAQRAVDALAQVYAVNAEAEDIAVCYAKGLTNLSSVQSLKDRSDTVDQLKALYKMHSDLQDIAVSYAMGLFNLSNTQPLEGRSATLEQLKTLCEKHSDWLDITVHYANGLVNLSSAQSPEDRSETIDQLKALYEKHSNWQDIAVLYAKGLVNLSNAQPLGDRSDTVDQLKALYEMHSDWQDIAIAYSGGLTNLALAQTAVDDVRRTCSESEAVLKKYPDNADIQLSHAQTWFNLTLVQAEADIPATVREIVGFLKAHPAAVPGFREALDAYLSKRPDHRERYQPLLELGGDRHD